MPAFTLEDQWRQYPDSWKKPAGVKLKPGIRRAPCDACGGVVDCLEVPLKNGLAPLDICIDCARVAYNTLQERT